jgi:hypothetical protein
VVSLFSARPCDLSDVSQDARDRYGFFAGGDRSVGIAEDCVHHARAGERGCDLVRIIDRSRDWEQSPSEVPSVPTREAPERTHKIA